MDKLLTAVLDAHGGLRNLNYNPPGSPLKHLVAFDEWGKICLKKSNMLAVAFWALRL